MERNMSLRTAAQIYTESKEKSVDRSQETGDLSYQHHILSPRNESRQPTFAPQKYFYSINVVVNIYLMDLQ